MTSITPGRWDDLRDEVVSLTGQIDDRLSHLERSKGVHTGSALDIARRHGATNVSLDKLRYVITLGLVQPVREKVGERCFYVFHRQHIRDIILIQTLREGYSDALGQSLTYTQIGSLLRDSRRAARAEISRDWDDAPLHEVEVVISQADRGLVMLGSHVLGRCLAWLFRGQIPESPAVVVRRRSSEISDSSPGRISCSHELRDFPTMDDLLGDLRADDLVYYVSPEGEALRHPIESLLPYHSLMWHHWTITRVNPRCDYDLVVGLPRPGATRNQVRLLSDETAARFLALLLEVCFLKMEPEGSEETRPLVGRRERRIRTPLSVIIHLLPDLSPVWQYCVIFVPDRRDPSRLRTAASSEHFVPNYPEEAIVEMGQLLSGWAYEHGYPVVVQRTTGPDDPRMCGQNSERAKAAIAIPTRAAGEINGVLYVGTREPLDPHSSAFSGSEVRLLQMLADILGEIIERNRIRACGEQMAIYTIDEPPRRGRSWSEYKDAIAETLRQVTSSEEVSTQRDNVQIMAVRIENYRELHDQDDRIASWVADHIRDTTHRFYLKHQLGIPTIFDRSDHNPSEFVCLLPRVSLNDEEDRQYRSTLRRLLNTLRIPFRVQEPTLAKCLVWSMPFRFSRLRQRLKQHGLEDVTGHLVKETEDALPALSYIEKGHGYEFQGRYALALEQYRLALQIVPHSLYIMRHIAKALAMLGDNLGALESWATVISQDPNPSHYRRIAHVLACLSQLELAIEYYEAALRLDPMDATCWVEWGDILLMQGETSSATEKYRQAQLWDETNSDVYSLRIAEAALRQSEAREAWNMVETVLARNPDSRDARRMRLRILLARDSAAPVAEVDKQAVERILGQCRTLLKPDTHT